MARQTKTNFTAADVENNLFKLATSVMNKSSDPKKTNAAVGAYNSILKLQSLKIQAAKLELTNNPMTTKKNTLALT